MPFDKFVDIPTITEARRTAIHECLRSISVDELNKIAKDHQEEFLDDPWREKFLRLIAGAFTMQCCRKASSSFTAVTKTLVSGSCPAAGWAHCQSTRNAMLKKPSQSRTHTELK